MFPVDANKILDYIAEYTSLSAESDPLQEECELTHKDLLAAEPNPSFPISLDSALETLPEPGTSREKRFTPPQSSLLDSRMNQRETIETPRIS